MNADDTSTDKTRLRCITTLLNLDDEALQIVDTLLTRVAVSDTLTERKPRVKQAKRVAAASAPTAEVAR